MPFAAVNTTILVLSSLTCQLGVFAAERGQVGRTGSLLKVSGWGLREWFVLTYVMGAIFIGGQVTSTPSSSRRASPSRTPPTARCST